MIEDWRARAGCRDVDTGVFFPESNLAEAHEEAKQVCFGCLVQQACLDYALQTQQPYGVWGGLTVREREVLMPRRGRRRRRRGLAA